MKRDADIFPYDDNGNVIWLMYKQGDDLSAIRKFDFSVIFPTEEAATQFSLQILKINQKPKFFKSDNEDKLEWEVVANPVMLPTYKNISNFEKQIGEDAVKFGGKNDGWGSFSQNVNVFRKLFRLLFIKIFIREIKNIQWAVTSHKYEGFPLITRYPTNLNFKELQKHFPLLLEVSLSFEEVLENGLPVPEYNKNKLFELDIYLVNYHNNAFSGQCVLVETFGGKRSYYFYVMQKFEISIFEKQIFEKYPEHKLEFYIKSNKDWSFIKQYAKEYFNLEKQYDKV